MSLIDDLIRDEGIRRYPYKDSMGIWTIGIGHNMQADPDMLMHLTKYQVEGISDKEMYDLLDKDIEKHSDDLFKAFPWVLSLSKNRIDAMINLCFNLGITKLSKFVHFLSSVKCGEWATAKLELVGMDGLPTKYYQQTGARAMRIADKLIVG